MTMTGYVTDIQKFSTHDGPGIRTTVFLKGCGMKCFWCHNPETISPHPQLQVYPNKCIGCGKCIDACPLGAHRVIDGHKTFLRELCKMNDPSNPFALCGKCAEVCYAGALTVIGRDMTVTEVVDKVYEDVAFYKNSGGGATFSGGEPLLQIDFLEGLLIECKTRNLHTVVDTAANVPWEHFARILGLTDLFLFDFKTFDSQKHKKVTGVGNERILNNLTELSIAGAEIIVRVPVIPGVNDEVVEMEKIINFIKNNTNISQVELLPFHRYGEGKYRSLGMEYTAMDCKPPEKKTIDRLAELIANTGIGVLYG